MDKNDKFLTVAPFRCAWMKEFKFREAGRGCVAFDAFARNDVTVVFRETVGTEHYHYKRDTSPHYTVIIGSHRNKRLKIEVDGKPVVDVEGIGLCSSSAFQSYWISVYDGLISIGRGRYPFQNIIFEWLDSKPNCSVQYVGLSSWDKHVGYRNINVLSSQPNHLLMWKLVDSNEEETKESSEKLDDEVLESGIWGLANYLDNWELADVIFIVGKAEIPVPGHKVVLQASGSFPLSSSNNDVIHLRDTNYSILRSFLRYIYTGRTQISLSELSSLSALSLKFEVMPLAKQCAETVEKFKFNKKLFDCGNRIEVVCPISLSHCATMFPSGYPISSQKLKQFQTTGEYSDVEVHLEDHNFSVHVHKVILSLWSLPFFKMFTNGMSETNSAQVYLRDVSPEAFTIMLDFMYGGQLAFKDSPCYGSLLLELLLLSDQCGVTILYQECCRTLFECLSEETVCPILQVVSSIPACKLMEETCERIFSTHFDYCTTATLDFVFLHEATFANIIKHQDLTVTSEEKVFNAILMWSMQADHLCGWEHVDTIMSDSSPELLFKERFHPAIKLLPWVRFPLLPCSLLQKLAESNLCKCLDVLNCLVKEAVDTPNFDSQSPESSQNLRFHHRRSSYKQLQYICDGDSNGVLYFAGTSFGQHQWLNPVLAKKIVVTASSPVSRYTDPKVLASRTYHGTSFAGPRISDGNKSTWWMVDLGQGHQLMCNYYTLRQDGSRTYVRFWNLQGSMDGCAWTNLIVHENDDTICKPAQYGSWPVRGPSALQPFRYFRILLTGPTTDCSSPWIICLCALELYGYFR